MARLILDTGVVIAAVRERVDLTAVADGDDIALPAVAVGEYLAGVELDGDDERAAAQRAFLDELLRLVPVVDYDVPVARAHAGLLADVRRRGQKRGTHDLIIAATAAATDRTVLTTNANARFADLLGVQSRVIDP